MLMLEGNGKADILWLKLVIHILYYISKVGRVIAGHRSGHGRNLGMSAGGKGQSFFLREQRGTPDLDLLITPACTWLYQMTGDPTYLIRRDLVFEGRVEGVWLDGSKQFSQNYRWSFDFVIWRSTSD